MFCWSYGVNHRKQFHLYRFRCERTVVIAPFQTLFHNSTICRCRMTLEKRFVLFPSGIYRSLAGIEQPHHVTSPVGRSPMWIASKVSSRPVLTAMVAGLVFLSAAAHQAQAKIRMYGGPVTSAPGGRYYPPGGQGAVVWSYSGNSHRSKKQLQDIPSHVLRIMPNYVPWEAVPAFSSRSNYLIPYTVGDFSKSADSEMDPNLTE